MRCSGRLFSVCWSLNGDPVQGETAMARKLIPSSFECDCGHESHFFERTISGMEKESRNSRKAIQIMDSETDEHAIEFKDGAAVAVICPKLGKCPITGWA